MKIREMTEADWGVVSRIYQEGIRTGCATFEALPPPSWDAWIPGRIRASCLVCERADEVVGWAALSPVSSRCVYQGVAEVSVYVAESQRRSGVGELLLQAIEQCSEQLGIWTLQAQMFPENRASIDLHIRNGFRVVGTRKRIGKMTYGRFKGQWKDNVLLERRSLAIGV